MMIAIMQKLNIYRPVAYLVITSFPCQKFGTKEKYCNVPSNIKESNNTSQVTFDSRFI